MNHKERYCPMINKNNHRISLVFPKQHYLDFEHYFPSCLSKFLRNAIVYAIKDRKFFEQVYFEELDDSYKEYAINNMIKKLDKVVR